MRVRVCACACARVCIYTHTLVTKQNVYRLLSKMVDDLPPSEDEFLPPVVILDANALEFERGLPYEVCPPQNKTTTV